MRSRQRERLSAKPRGQNERATVVLSGIAHAERRAGSLGTHECCRRRRRLHGRLLRRFPLSGLWTPMAGRVGAMNKRHRVFVILDPDTGKPTRILRRADFKMSGPAPIEWPRTDAVRSIRQQVYERDKECQRCGKPLTWATGHLDEKVSRGEGGEISLDNCWMLCARCHILSPTSEHSNRSLRFGERNDQDVL